MTAQADKFFADVAGDAQLASARTGVPVSTILAQWANETGYGTSSAWVKGHNYAGVSASGHVDTYPDRAAGLAAYIKTLLLPYYKDVRAADNPTAAALAFGKSPWAAGKYLGVAPYNSPGGALVQILHDNNLTRFDTPGTPAGRPASSAGGDASAGDLLGGAVNTVGGLAKGALDAIDPTKVPGRAVSGIKGLLAGVQGDVTRVALTGILLAGGVAMVVGGAYLAAKPQLQPVVDQAKQAGTQAAMAAAMA